MTDEFSLISRYFAKFSQKTGDDCAILDLHPGEQLATSVDTLVEGVHFYADAPPDRVGYRAVVTALSDLAATGAEPRAITLALTLPEATESWLAQFSRGVEQATVAYEVELIGGDTTQGHLTITVQVLGAVPAGQALTRGGAKPGDRVYISGTTGDAAAALTVMNGHWPGQNQYREYLLKRFYRPTARIELGLQLRELATSAIDISDGLLADARHIAEQSRVGISIDAGKVPLSPALQSLPDQQQAKTWALGGGDDYELLFTISPDDADKIPTNCTHIGGVFHGSGVQCDVEAPANGYVHFGSAPTPAAQVAEPPLVEPTAIKPRPFANLIQFLAFGFGSGLAPKAPGTVGTVMAIPLYLALSQFSLPVYTALVIAASVIGIWICGSTSKQLKVPDHPGIVWDEFAGYWITMWALPTSWVTVVLGFVVFRAFDILKPWPIRAFDKNVGGFGIMIDGVLAGIAGCAVVHGILALL